MEQKDLIRLNSVPVGVLRKTKVYLNAGDKAPDGVQTFTGKHGGKFYYSGQVSGKPKEPSKETNTDRKTPNDSKSEGDCYDANGRFFLDLADSFENPDSLRMCHGYPTGQGEIMGVVHGHAWIEVNNKIIIDRSNGRNISMEKSRYYAIGKIKESDVQKYTINEFRTKLLDEGHWGPFDVDEKKLEVEEFRQPYLALEPKLHSILKSVFKGKQILTRVKTTESINEKVDRKGYDKDKMSDVLGARVLFTKLSEVLESTEVIRQNFDVIKEKDYINHQHETSEYYSAYHFIVNLDGLKAEIQLKTHLQNKLSNVGHRFVYKDSILDKSELGEFTNFLNEMNKFALGKQMNKPSTPNIVVRMAEKI